MTLSGGTATAAALSQQFLSVIDELEATLLASARLADDRDNDNRQEGIKLRRVIADKLLIVSQLGQAAFRDTDQSATFQRKFSSMRAILAHHQASWPIVSIDSADPAYIASVREMREANRGFIIWVRNAVAALPRSALDQS